jgi:hypothetical protein
METQTLDRLTRELSADGYDTTALLEIRLELELMERPPSLVTRMTQAARAAASRHWSNLVGELGESREAMSIIVTVMRGGEVTPSDRDKVRAQMLDLVRLFPAGIIAAANSAFPIPGTGLFTPWILAKLGLMPSRWREAHLLEQLRKERDHLRATGHGAEADAIEELRQQIEHDVEEKEQAGQNATVLTHWDRNRNGSWDPDEIVEYLAELERVRRFAKKFAHRKQWFLETEGEIFGALRLNEVCTDADCCDHLEDDSILVCFDGKSGWVALPDLLGRRPRFG